MSGSPGIIDPSIVARADRQVRASEVCAQWCNAMKREHLAACLFTLQGELCDDEAFVIGALDTLLREAGYTIASHSTTPIARAGSGRMVVLNSFLVRATAEAPRVILG